jgi:hypothetical protein
MLKVGAAGAHVLKHSKNQATCTNQISRRARDGLLKRIQKRQLFDTIA